LIESLRDNEFKWLTKSQFIKAYGTLLYWMSPTIISSVVFMGCAMFHSAPINASTVFTVLATLRSMGEPVRMIPEALSSLIQVKVSLDRLNAFLLDDELKKECKNTSRQLQLGSGNNNSNSKRSELRNKMGAESCYLWASWGWEIITSLCCTRGNTQNFRNSECKIKP